MLQPLSSGPIALHRVLVCSRLIGIHSHDQMTCVKEEYLLCRLADAALVKLGKQLRSLSSLPLKITSLQPISASSRHVNPFSPLPHPFAGARLHRDNPVLRCIDPLECLLQFEASGQPPTSWYSFSYHCLVAILYSYKKIKLISVS